jgi:hypothetical protein
MACNELGSIIRPWRRRNQSATSAMEANCAYGVKTAQAPGYLALYEDKTGLRFFFSSPKRQDRLWGQATPSQSSNGRGGDLREVPVDVRLSAIPAFDRKAGLNNRHLNSNRGICLRWRFWSQAEGLDWSCQCLAPSWHFTNFGRNKLCLVGCLGSEPRLAESQTGGMRLFPGA